MLNQEFKVSTIARLESTESVYNRFLGRFETRHTYRALDLTFEGYSKMGNWLSVKLLDIKDGGRI